MSAFWILPEQRMMEVVSDDNWNYNTWKAPVESPPTNRHPVVFTGRMPLLSPNQQCQSSEGKSRRCIICKMLLHQSAEVCLLRDEWSVQSGSCVNYQWCCPSVVPGIKWYDVIFGDDVQCRTIHPSLTEVIRARRLTLVLHITQTLPGGSYVH